MALNISPASGTPGTRISIQGTSFGRKQSGSIKIDGVSLGTFRTTPQGVLSVEVTIPSNTAPGARTISASTSSSTQTATFTVEANTPVPSPPPEPPPSGEETYTIPEGATTISAGANLQTALTAGTTGQAFVLANGSYTISTSVKPKAGQKLYAATPRGAILNGNNTAPVAIECPGIIGVELYGLVIENFATPDQGGYGAVRLGPNGKMHNCAVRNNRYQGIWHTNDCTIQFCDVHGNGVSGIVGYKCDRTLIHKNHIYSNGARNLGGLSGGTKWTLGRDMQIAYNLIENNTNNGLWMDGGNINYDIHHNTLKNSGRGLHLEVGCGGIVRFNTIENNTNVGIEIVCSRDADIFSNTIRNNANGVRAQYQPYRSTAAGSGFSFVDVNCEWDTIGNKVHDNDIYMAAGYTGLIKWDPSVTLSDAEAYRIERCLFSANRYFFHNLTTPFRWLNANRTIAQWQAYGQDTGSSFETY